MRLLAGLLAGQDGRRFELVGDESLSARPMERVAEPLRRMGATVETTDGHAPLVVEGARAPGDRLRAPGRLGAGEVGDAARRACWRPARRRSWSRCRRGTTRSACSSARARAVTRRPRASRSSAPTSARARRGRDPRRLLVRRPAARRRGDRPGLRAHRARRRPQPAAHGLLDVLERMGARIAIYNRRSSAASRRATSRCAPRSSSARAMTAGGGARARGRAAASSPLAAAHARGESIVRGAGELRVKETDRLEAVAEELRRLGGHVRATGDGLRIRGVPARLRGGVVRRARRPPARDARRRRGRVLAGGRRAAGRRGGRDELSRLLRGARAADSGLRRGS